MTGRAVGTDRRQRHPRNRGKRLHDSHLHQDAQTVEPSHRIGSRRRCACRTRLQLLPDSQLVRQKFAF